MKTRPSFEIIPNSPIEELEYYEEYLKDLKNSKPGNTESAALTIIQIQNVRTNIRALKERLKK